MKVCSHPVVRRAADKVGSQRLVICLVKELNAREIPYVSAIPVITSYGHRLTVLEHHSRVVGAPDV